MAVTSKNVEIRLRDGQTVSGRLAGPFRPAEKRIIVRRQNEVCVYPLDEVVCIFFLGDGKGVDVRLPGEVLDDVQTVDGDTIKVRVLKQQPIEEGFYAIPVEYDDRVQRIFFTRAGVRSRQEERPLGEILRDDGIAAEQEVQAALKEQQRLRERKIGQIVREQHGVPRAAVERAERQKQRAPAKKGKMKLGDILIEAGLITEQQLAEALELQRSGSSKHLGDILIGKGIITEEQLVKSLAKKFRLKFVDLEDIEINPDALEAVSTELALRLHVLPIDIDDRRVVVATSEPTNASIADALRFRTGLWVELVVATPSQIKEALGKHVGVEEELVQLAVEAGGEHEEEEIEDARKLEAEAEQAPIVRLSNKILLEGIRAGASDIHVFPTENSVKVSFRVHGLLKEHLKLEKKIHLSLITRFKIIAGMDIAEHRMPQDGRIKISSEGRKVEIRVSCMPGLHGENMVFRILNQGVEQRRLDDLGFEPEVVAAIRRIVQAHHGMMLVTGPTGSGKSTTMLAVMRDLTNKPKHLISLEDPIEGQVPGVNQIQINEKIGFTFASALRNILRHDPDVIMVGEIRDSETAKIAVQAALTGHVLISSLHTNTAVGAFMRLEDMGVEAFMVASTVRGVVAQQLLPRLCEHCREKREADPEVLEFIRRRGIDMGQAADYQATGCRQCDDTGVSGRIMVYEFLEVNRHIQAMINKGSPEEEIQKQAREAGMISMAERAARAASEGLITLDSVVSLLSD